MAELGMTIGEVRTKIEASGMVLQESSGVLGMQHPYGKPPDEIVAMVRRNRHALTEVVRLEQRLLNGERRCALDPENEEMEAFWMGLLRELEQAYDQEAQ